MGSSEFANKSVPDYERRGKVEYGRWDDSDPGSLFDIYCSPRLD